MFAKMSQFDFFLAHSFLISFLPNLDSYLLNFVDSLHKIKSAVVLVSSYEQDTPFFLLLLFSFLVLLLFDILVCLLIVDREENSLISIMAALVISFSLLFTGKLSFNNQKS